MEETVTLNAAVNSPAKHRADYVSLTDGIPLMAKFPPVPAEINAESMSAEEISTKLRRGYDDIEAGRVRNAASAFEQRRKQRNEVL